MLTVFKAYLHTQCSNSEREATYLTLLIYFSNVFDHISLSIIRILLSSCSNQDSANQLWENMVQVTWSSVYYSLSERKFKGLYSQKINILYLVSYLYILYLENQK